MRVTHRLVLVVVTSLLTACSGSDAPPAGSTGPRNDSTLIVSLSAQTDTIPEATTKQLTARVTDQTGFLKAVPISWSSTAPSIASVSNGLVTGMSQGTALIVASVTGGADTAQIVVTENGVILDVQPSAAVVAMGDTIDFVATLRSRSGAVIHVTDFTWSTSDSTAAKFVGAGLLHTRKEGELSVSAGALARQGNSTIRVFRSPVASVTISPSTANVYKGASTALTVTLRDQNGRLVEGDVTWGSSDFSKATVDQNGNVTGLSGGTVVITATSERKTGSATVNVLTPPAAALVVSLQSTALVVGGEVQATATPTDASGAVLTGKTIGWQSSNPSVTTVSPAGTVKGIAAGNSTISAIVDGIVARQAVTVTGGRATSISISPNAPNVMVGQQSQLSAQVLDQNGSVMTGQSITWSSSAPAIASISASGLMQGISFGTTTITVTSGLLSATATASVTSVPVASVRVNPTSLALTAGNTGSVSAQALDANGNVLSGRVVTWSSANPTVATVNNAGIATAIGSGSTTLTATVEGKSAGVAMSVNPAPLAPVANITVSLASPALNVGQTTQATATLKDASNNTLTDRALSWYSLDTTVAKVSSSGLVTAVGGGTVAIMVASEGKSSSASLTVNAPTAAPVAKVTISAPVYSLAVNESVQTVVTLFDASGHVLTGRTITYSSEDGTILNVSASGVVKGLAGGVTRMRATSGGITAAEGFTVTAPTAPTTVASIVVTPNSSNLTVGQTVQASATAKTAQGAAISGTAFTWTTSNSAVAVVSGSGLVSAVGAGSAMIYAVASGVTGSMSVTSSSPAPTGGVVSSVVVTLSPSSLVEGSSAQATAVARDANGVVISGKTPTWSLGGSTLAQISTSGVVTALVAGTVPVTATIDGRSGSASLTISAAVAPPPGSGVVELPRVFLNYSYPAKTGQTITVPAGGDLQNALNIAQRGDEIVLAAGATFIGNFTLPAKAGTAANGWIVVRSDKLNQLPAQGNRVSASHATLMPRILTDNTQPALQTSEAATGWWLAGLEVSISPSLTAQQYGIITLGGNQTSLSAAPKDLVLDRMYIHGQTTSNVSRCVALNSGATQISDSYITECHGKDFQAQAVAGWNGGGPFKIVNNMLMGSGEGLMFGGADPATPNLIPSDIEIRRNYLYTPVAWKGVWYKANLLETKNAVRVLIEGNVFDGSWTNAQTGWAMILKSENQSGACRWCRTTDVTIRRNLITNAGGGINIAPRTNGSDSTTSRIQIYENVLENIGVGAFTGDQRGFQFLTTTKNLTIERTVLSGSLASALVTEGGAPCVLKDNVWAAGSYGVVAGGYGPGTSSLNAGCGTFVWSSMTLVGSSSGNAYPAGTTWVSSESQVPLAAQIRSIVQQAVSGVAIP